MKVYSKSEGPKLWLAAVPAQCSLVRVGWRFSCEGKRRSSIEAELATLLDYCYRIHHPGASG